MKFWISAYYQQSFFYRMKAGRGETVKAEQSQLVPSNIPTIGKGVGSW